MAKMKKKGKKKPRTFAACLSAEPFRETILRFAAVAGRKSGHCHF